MLKQSTLRVLFRGGIVALTYALGWDALKQSTPESLSQEVGLRLSPVPWGGMRRSRAPPRVLVRRWACGSDLCPGLVCAEARHPRESWSGGGPATQTCALGVGCAEAEHRRQSWSGGGLAALTCALGVGCAEAGHRASLGQEVGLQL